MGYTCSLANLACSCICACRDSTWSDNAWLSCSYFCSGDIAIGDWERTCCFLVSSETIKLVYQDKCLEQTKT